MTNKKGIGNILPLLNSSGVAVASGGVVVEGNLVGIATKTHPNNVRQDCDMSGVFDLPVTDTAGGIAIGDVLTCTLATGVISDAAVGAGVVFFGHALGTVDAGATATIPTRKVY